MLLAGCERRRIIDDFGRGRIVEHGLRHRVGFGRGLRHAGRVQHLGVGGGLVCGCALRLEIGGRFHHEPFVRRAGRLKGDLPCGREPDGLATDAAHGPAFVTEGGGLDLVGTRAMGADDQHARDGLTNHGVKGRCHDPSKRPLTDRKP